MKVSARNVFEGVVSAIVPGAVNFEIELTLSGGDKIVAIVTRSSVEALGLAVGKPAVALVKAPWVMLLADDPDGRLSARNRLRGVVSAINKGAVSSEVSVRLQGGNEVHAVVTNDAVGELALAVGKPVTALIKASDVILGVAG